MTEIQIRGIYATALTELFSDNTTIVNASNPIERRFDQQFPIKEPDVVIRTTKNRQGVGLHGEKSVVESLRRRLESIAIDSFSWSDNAPLGAIFDAVVTETLDSGAILDLGCREGFLPDNATEEEIEVGESYRVQVHEPIPPWRDRRPSVGPTFRIFGTLAELREDRDGISVANSNPAIANELARTTELLSEDPPEGWGLQWSQLASEADLEALETALSSLRERAMKLVEQNVSDRATGWVRFGRDSRFALDEFRASIENTLTGHHRIKAGGSRASDAVDFAERLGVTDNEFHFEAVAKTFGPTAGEEIEIKHGKPDGQQFSLGTGEVLDREGATITVRREITGSGTYDGLETPKESGDVATTTFREGRWWYPTTYKGAEGESKGTYVNVCTPLEIFPDWVSYVDLYIDVIRRPDGTITQLDMVELDEALAAGHISEALSKRAHDVADGVERALP